jgi:hypothetical protein
VCAGSSHTFDLLWRLFMLAEIRQLRAEARLLRADC